MHEVPVLHIADAVGPLLGAAAFVAVMSLVREPARHNLNALLVAGSTLAYLSGGFGVWELVYPAVATPVAYLALRSYRFVGIGWLMHAASDILHHLFGNPIWPFMPTSSFGCLVFDSAIAVWFFAGAPTLVRLPRWHPSPARTSTRRE
jgi:hypothetical protein